MQETERAAPPSTEGMVEYGENSRAQFELIRFHEARIRALAARVDVGAAQIEIADYGCGPGPTAVQAVVPAVQALRARFAEAPITVRHVDQPGNDWNALFRRATGEQGYGAGPGPVRTEASIGSFYDVCAAPGSIVLGTSFAAAHWLSAAPHVEAPDAVWFADLDGAPRDALAALAERDWRRFLKCRASELRPGGALLVSSLGSVPDANEANGSACSGRGIYRALQRVAREMVDEGLLRPDVLDAFVFGLWFMTEAEVRRPLVEDAALARAFEIEHVAVEPAAVNPGDVFADLVDRPDLYAERYTGYTRAFADSTLRTQLFEPSAENETEVQRLSDAFYRRFEALYRRHTTRYACELWYWTVVLRRTEAEAPREEPAATP